MRWWMNRNGLIAAAMVTHAGWIRGTGCGSADDREEAAGARACRITVGADKAYDTEDFVRTVRELRVTPHVTKNG